MKNTQSKLKPLKFGEELGTNYCSGCKDFTHNFKPQKVKMTNKVLREKSSWIVCWSSKSRLLKQKHNKEWFNALQTDIIKIKWKLIA